MTKGGGSPGTGPPPPGGTFSARSVDPFHRPPTQRREGRLGLPARDRGARHLGHPVEQAGSGEMRPRRRGQIFSLGRRRRLVVEGSEQQLAHLAFRCALGAADRKHSAERKSLAEREAALSRERRALEARQSKERERLEARLKKAEDAYRQAIRRWRG